jgi:predicted TIM-barrel fold metal-dependent hydrolase
MSCYGCSGTNPGTVDQHEGMTAEELKKMPKIDFHVHLDALAESGEAEFFSVLREHNMKWLTLATVGTHWKNLRQQIQVAEKLHGKYPGQVAWVTSFNLENWGDADWQSSAIGQIEAGFAAGALGVKVWKEIGMVLRDPDSSFVMIDDPRFDPIFEYITSRGKTLTAHIGEPRNCWLPLEEMTVNNDRAYFAENPQYHSYLHPEIPHYWKHIEARDRVLEKHPGLRFVGCHLGSLEFDVDEMAERFDRFPNFVVDMAARICHFQVQDREKVRNFCIKYQDRLLYGTDLAVSSTYDKPALAKALERIKATYNRDYRYFATDEEMAVPEISGKFHGLALPAGVLKKIFYENAEKWYPGILSN